MSGLSITVAIIALTHGLGQVTQPSTQPAVVVPITMIEAPYAGVTFGVPDGWTRRIGQSPQELYRAERLLPTASRAALVVTCENAKGNSPEQVAQHMAMEARRLRRQIVPSRTGTIEVGDHQLYEVAGESRLGQRSDPFIWRILPRDEWVYTVSLLQSAGTTPEGVAELDAVADAICGSMTLTESGDPSATVYTLGSPTDMPRLGLRLAVPEAWYWQGMPQSEAIAVARGVMDYRRGVPMPALLVRIEHCPPGVTAQQIAEGSCRALSAQSDNPKSVEQTRSGTARWGQFDAHDVTVSVAGAQPYTEARRCAVDGKRAVTLIVRYADEGNPHAEAMLRNIVDASELRPMK